MLLWDLCLLWLSVLKVLAAEEAEKGFARTALWYMVYLAEGRSAADLEVEGDMDATHFAATADHAGLAYLKSPTIVGGG